MVPIPLADLVAVEAHLFSDHDTLVDGPLGGIFLKFLREELDVVLGLPLSAVGEGGGQP